MDHIEIKKGHNIRISGLPIGNPVSVPMSETVAIYPYEFQGVKPKLMIKEGEKVMLGSPLFFDKSQPKVRWPSPANGIVQSIHFGARRVIKKIEISVIGDDAVEGPVYTKEKLYDLNREDILKIILDANLFPIIRQRPFNKVANPMDKPRDIFVSAINTAPLSVDLDQVLYLEKNNFQIGITALSRLVGKDIFVTLKKDSKIIDISDATIQTITHLHPGGNVGIQIHNSRPIKPGDIIWTVDAQNVISLGKLFLTGKYDTKRILSIAGPGTSNPQFVSSNVGSSIKSLIVNQEFDLPVRLISGDVLTGVKKDPDEFLGFYDTAITILPDIVERPFMGMLQLGSSKTKYSLINAFLSFGRTLFEFNTSQNGEERAMVPIDAWEKVLPMDILPNALFRAILAEDIEEMEKLGIWECDDEDFALCSFACPSKIDVGNVIRKGLNLMGSEG
ncbi:MAG: hypothetical protein CMG74_07305 [Candidatus Marinimicrobia bacterium]|nr:hypothetical protein [Candidatus Neomarinimicrobiota bacterium]